MANTDHLNLGYLHGPTNFQTKNLLLILLKISNLRNHLSFNGSDRWESHKSYKGTSIKAYLSFQGLSYEVIYEFM